MFLCDLYCVLILTIPLSHFSLDAFCYIQKRQLCSPEGNIHMILPFHCFLWFYNLKKNIYIYREYLSRYYIGQVLCRNAGRQLGLGLLFVDLYLPAGLHQLVSGLQEEEQGKQKLLLCLVLIRLTSSIETRIMMLLFG